jgi:phosphinothricin acetyltransferase
MIRQALEKDLHEILEIYNHAVLNTTAVYTYKAQAYEDRKLWFDNKKAEGYPVFVYEENGKVAGFATYGPFRAWPAYKYTIEHSVYVKPDCRSKGIGTILMKELIKDSNERGYATMVAGIDSLNDRSIKMHEKLGFECSGVIKRAGYKFEKWLDLVFYQLSLKGPQNPIEE